MPATGEGGAAKSSPDDGRDPVASSERGEVAGGAGSAGAVVEGGPDVHSLVQAGGLGATADPGSEGSRRAEHDIPRRDEHLRSSEGRRRASKEDKSEQRDEREALG